MTSLACTDFLACIHEFGMISSNYGSITAALLVAFALFLIKELSNRGSQYSGKYHIKTITNTSIEPRHHNLEMFFTFIICSDGYEISGTCEKTGEKNADGEEIIYRGKNRKRGIVTGHIERNYIFNSVMHLHITEKGKDREFSTYMSIKFKRISWPNSLFKGVFSSTAADSQGEIFCQRSSFSEHPKKYAPARPNS